MPAKGHALLSPSKAARWLTCTKSAKLESEFPDEYSPYAAEGTLAHAIAEIVTSARLGLMDSSAARDLIEEHKKNELFSEEMLSHASDYADYIEEHSKKLIDANVMLEVKLNISKYAPECFGTGDCVIVGEGVLEIIDYKYGKGCLVQAADNPQMKLYGLGAVLAFDDLFDFKKVKMTIYQPRIAHGVSSFEMTKAALLKWGKSTVIPQAKKAFNGEGEFAPSEEACRFCKARAHCRARADLNFAMFDDTDSDTITVEEAARILEKAGDIKNWLSDLEGRVFNELMSGKPVENWKLVEGKSNRKFTDPEAVATALLKTGYKESEIYEKKLITLTAVEKLLGKGQTQEILGELIIKPKGSPTLAKASDPRPEMNIEEQIIKSFEEE